MVATGTVADTTTKVRPAAPVLASSAFPCANSLPATGSYALTNRPDVILDRDPDFGTPHFVRRRSSFLSPPALGATPEQILTAFIEANARKFTLAPSDLQPPNAVLHQDYETKHNGMRHVRWQQQKDGLDIFGATFALNLTKDNEIINVSSRALNIPEVRFHRNEKVTADEAVRVGTEYLNKRNSSSLPSRSSVQNPNPQPSLLWYPLDMISAVKAWDMYLDAGHETHRLIVRADTGEVVKDINLTWSLDPITFNVYTNESPTPFSPGTTSPTNFVPPQVSRAFVTLSALDTNASPAGWIADGENNTKGNNTDAFADWDDDDAPDPARPRPTGSPYRVFDAPLYLTNPPGAYVDAAVIQAFYLVNMFHDRLYALGFDEGAGNFQQSNFGRGGREGDRIYVNVQDGWNTGKENNANFTAFDDGGIGRMQLYVWTHSVPDRDCALDAEVVFHEAVHGVSTRLIGNGFGLSTSQARGMSEGWSDFMALSLTSEAGDDPDGCYPYGAYVDDWYLYSIKDNYYYGIRRFPYSTDITKAPQTFADTDPNQLQFPPEVPMNPKLHWNLEADEIHRIGEVWCLALWECRANIVEQYGFAGNELFLQLVVDGMKLTPYAPTFAQARDAILQADMVDNGGTNAIALWRGFAKRGLGYSAVVPGSSSTVGIKEAFDLPFGVEAHLTEGVGDGDGYLEPVEAGTLTVTLTSRELGLSNVTAFLSVLSSNITVTASNAALPNVMAGGTGTSTPPFAFSVATSFPGFTDAQFLLRIESDKGWFEEPLFVRIGNPYDYAPEILNIAVTNISETNAWLSWRTGIPANGLVEYGTTSGYGLSTSLDPVMRTNHMAELPGLAKGTDYHFHIISHGTNGLTGISTDRVFRTRSRIYVNVNSTAADELGTIEAPFKTLQAAADAAGGRDEILVAEGVYTSETAEAVLELNGGGGFKLFGGYNGDFSVQDPAAHVTTLDGENARRGIYLNWGANLELNDIGVRDGCHEWGGAVTVRNNSIFTARNCKFTGNMSTGVNNIGGALHVSLGAKVTLENCLIENNTAPGGGGGVFAVSSGTTVTLRGCKLKHNFGVVGGGVELLGASEAYIAQCIFTENSAQQQAGGLRVAPFSSAVIEESTVASNVVLAASLYAGGGGGILVAGVSSSATLTMNNCIVYGNSSDYGNDLRCCELSEVHVNYSDIGDISGNLTSSNRLLRADPLFADPDGGDLHLKSAGGRWVPGLGVWTNDAITSPCIDAGNPADEFGNEPWPNGMRINMGAYGNTSEASKSPPWELVVDGFPARHGASAPYGYGTNAVPFGDSLTETVVSPADAINDVRYVCTGWTGTGSLPASGNTNAVMFVMGTNSTLTWQWQTQRYLRLSAMNGAITGTTEGWKDEGFIYDLIPAPGLGYLFDHWTVNGTNAGTNVPLSVTMDGTNTVAAVFQVNFVDVTGVTETSFPQWFLSRQTGTYFGTLRLANKADSGKLLRDKFWYAIESSSDLRLMQPTGTLPDGKQYIDITAQVLAALPGVGNGDLVLDPGEAVLIPNIEFYSRDRSIPTGFAFAIWADPPADAVDMSFRDTDRDGMPNGWEQTHGLNENNPGDGTADADRDGMCNRSEYAADTDPNDPDSCLRIRALQIEGGLPRLEWTGGESATQYVDESCFPAGPWTPIRTNLPPTSATNDTSVDKLDNAARFFRIRVER